jgi:hypothetical protein
MLESTQMSAKQSTTVRSAMSITTAPRADGLLEVLEVR